MGWGGTIVCSSVGVGDRMRKIAVYKYMYNWELNWLFMTSLKIQLK